MTSGSNVNAQDSQGLTPLMVCCAEDTDYDLEARCVAYLLSHKANPDLADKNVRLDFFYKRNYGKLVSLLLFRATPLFTTPPPPATPRASSTCSTTCPERSSPSSCPPHSQASLSSSAMQSFVNKICSFRRAIFFYLIGRISYKSTQLT